MKKYLFYAIGEIFLVMIGILLALQVSNWNQDRMTRTKELKALKDLNKEFLTNKERINKKQDLRKSIAPKLASYIKLISSNNANHNSYSKFHSEQFMFGMTNPSNGVINAMISSGEISIISNDSLKYLIADWNNQLENLYENEEILWESGLEYIETSSSKMPQGNYNWYDWDERKLETAFNNLSSNIGYRNKLIGFYGVYLIVIEECNDLLDVLENILYQIDKEIKKLE